MTTNRPADITLPNGWTWERVEAARAQWDIASDMVPIAVAPGVAVWGTINSVRLERVSFVDVSNIQEYGPTQKLSQSIRVF